MIEERFRGNKTSARGMYMRSIADITPEWKDIRIADIIPDRSNICSIADIPEFNEMLASVPNGIKLKKLYKIKNKGENYGNWEFL